MTNYIQTSVFLQYFKLIIIKIGIYNCACMEAGFSQILHYLILHFS